MGTGVLLAEPSAFTDVQEKKATKVTAHWEKNQAMGGNPVSMSQFKLAFVRPRRIEEKPWKRH